MKTVTCNLCGQPDDALERAQRAEEALNEIAAKPYRAEEIIAKFIEEARLRRLAGFSKPS